VSNDFAERLLRKLDEAFESGTDSLDIDEVANAAATTDQEREDVHDLVRDLETTSLLFFEWDSIPVSCMSLELLRTADNHGYVISPRDEDMPRPTSAWARVTDCSNSASVSTAVKRALADEFSPLWSIPTRIYSGGVVDRAIVAEAFVALPEGGGFFGSPWLHLAERVALPADAAARVKARSAVGHSGAEQLSQVLTVADKEQMVKSYMETAYRVEPDR
jgi:hypothetical protein